MEEELMPAFFLSVLLATVAPAESLPEGFIEQSQPEERVLVEVTVPHKGRYCGIHMIVNGRHELLLLELKPGETLLYEEEWYIECSKNMEKIHRSEDRYWDHTPLKGGRSRWTPRRGPPPE